MNYLLRKEYNNYFDYLGKIVIMLYEEDKSNQDGKNLIKATSKIGTYVNSLHLDYDMTKTRLDAFKKENRELRQEIQELKKQLEK
jgi:hypothetical protein